MGRSSIISTSGSSPFYNRSQNNGLCNGPRRVICFCFFAIITPAVFISVPLLMRFVVYGSASYHISPSDMRIIDEKISTIWCRKQTLKANVTFTAYDSDGTPELTKAAEPLRFKKTLIIPDDYKEYWGFYLLQGSQYRISSCARFKGGSLLIVKGRQHLDYCAYIGNLDSTQDSDETSDSMSNERNPSDPDFGQTSKFSINKGRVKVVPTTAHPSSQEEMSLLLSKIRTYVKNKPDRYMKLRKKLFDWDIALSSVESNGKSQPTIITSTTQPTQAQPEIKNHSESNNNLSQENPTTDPNTTPLPAQHHHHYDSNKIRHAKSRNLLETENLEHGKVVRRKRHDVQIQKFSESGEDGAFEDLNERLNEIEETADINKTQEPPPLAPKYTPDSIWKKHHSIHSGAFNTTDENDGSDSESESSYSSSEEALAKCEGIIATFYLKPMAECGTENETNIDFIPLLFNSTVDVSGYYYFILGSENEKRDNFIQIKFELEKYEYQLPKPLPNCTNVQHCELDLKFGSSQKMVISVPNPSPDRGEIWDEYYVAESECEPRTGLYLIFVLCLPVMILMCAFQ